MGDRRLAPSTRDPPARAPLRPARSRTTAGAARADRARQALGTVGERAPARNRRCRTRSDRARQVVMGGTVDDRRQRRRAGRAARAAGRGPRRGGGAFVRVRGRDAPGRRPSRPGRGTGVTRPRHRAGRRVDAGDRRRDAGLPGLFRRRGSPGGENQRLVGGCRPCGGRCRTRRTPRRAAGRAVHLAAEPARDDGLLERVGSRDRVAAQGNWHDAGAGGATRHRSQKRRSKRKKWS